MSMSRQQAGLTFSGFLIGTFILVVVVLFGFKLIPAYMEDAQIQSLLVAVAHDPDMKSATVSELRSAFGRRAAVNWVSGVKPENLEITRDESGRPVLSANYEVRIKVAGNATLLLDFKPSSEGK